MQTTAFGIQNNIPCFDEYTDCYQHIRDELMRLDFVLRIYLLSSKKSLSNSLFEQLKGLVLSDEEINSLLYEKSDKKTEKDEYLQLKLQLQELDHRIRKRRAISLEKGICLPSEYLSGLFKLTPFEEQCVIICLAPELDTKYEKLYAYIQDDVTRKMPSVDLCLKLLCGSDEERILARRFFNSDTFLMRYILQTPDNSNTNSRYLLSSSLKLDNRLVDYLLGSDGVDSRINAFARVVNPGETAEEQEVPAGRQAEIKSLAALGRKRIEQQGQNLMFYFHGPNGAGKKLTARLICSQIGLSLLVVDLSKAAASGQPLRDIIMLSCREALLQQGLVCFDSIGCIVEGDKGSSNLSDLVAVLAELSPVSFLIGDARWRTGFLFESITFLEKEFSVPSDTERERFWDQLSRSRGLDVKTFDSTIAAKFRFTPGQMINAVEMAEMLAMKRGLGSQVATEDLYSACRFLSNHKLDEMAKKVDTRYGWNDIILPQDQLKQLKELCSQVKFKGVVFGQWGFGEKNVRGRGLNAVFTGPPGTGKTMAAEIVANELKLELYRINLSQVVSKYIGETEKNLQNIFNEAESSNAILFFDEADALFGKRSEVKDAHDRYANIEVAFLLQKMEEYDGITILATNFSNNLDEAFKRRMRFSVDFSFPDSVHRRKIWDIVFPNQGILSDDIDMEFLAKKFELAGGNIRNIALTSAFLAAEDGNLIMMKHVINAVRREFQKMGKVFVRSDFDKYQHLIAE